MLLASEVCREASKDQNFLQFNRLRGNYFALTICLMEAPGVSQESLVRRETNRTEHLPGKTAQANCSRQVPGDSQFPESALFVTFCPALTWLLLVDWLLLP